MCGRYSLSDAEKIETRFDAESTKQVELKPNYNVAPTQIMPVITMSDDGKLQIEMMKWGIPRKLFLSGKSVEKELINTQSEKAFQRFWGKTVRNQRCLVPANGFYEWKGPKGNKTPYFIHPKNEALFAFAGIWDTYEHDGQKIKVYSIMTTEPNAEMREIHNREPVMLHREDESSWLEPTDDSQSVLERLLYPYEDNGLEIYEVSRDVNVVKNNNGKLFLTINRQRVYHL
jgi:putative SOS response-associated peptidase YedK